MINIIEHGFKKEEKVFYKIFCQECCCKFEVDDFEFLEQAKCLFTDSHWYAKAACPDCKNIITINNMVEQRHDTIIIPFKDWKKN